MHAGKAMNETKTEVRIQFKSQSGFFGDGADGFRNEFVMQLKPKDLMYLKMVVKKPGLDMDASMSELNLTYQDRCGSVQCLSCCYLCCVSHRSPLLCVSHRSITLCCVGLCGKQLASSPQLVTNRIQHSVAKVLFANWQPALQWLQDVASCIYPRTWQIFVLEAPCKCM